MKVDHANVATAVFSQPPVGTVGLTERQARAEARAIDVYRTRFRPMKHTLTGREERTMMKLVVDRASDRVLGCHMVGADAPEIIQGLAIAVKCGATKRQFDQTDRHPPDRGGGIRHHARQGARSGSGAVNVRGMHLMSRAARR